jgi:hypothetical protein
MAVDALVVSVIIVGAGEVVDGRYIAMAPTCERAT